MCLSKLHSKKILKDQYKSLQTSSEIITAKRKKMLHESDKRNSPKCFSKSFSDNKYEANCSAVYSISNSSVQEINEDYNFNKSPVSIWRTYFIANQWLKLQTERKTNVMIQLFAVLGIFQVNLNCIKGKLEIKLRIKIKLYILHRLYNYTLGFLRYKN